jgi:hypothetical protein
MSVAKPVVTRVLILFVISNCGLCAPRAVFVIIVFLCEARVVTQGGRNESETYKKSVHFRTDTQISKAIYGKT